MIPCVTVSPLLLFVMAATPDIVLVAVTMRVVMSPGLKLIPETLKRVVEVPMVSTGPACAREK